MTALTDFTRNGLLDLTLTGTAFTQPAGLWAGVLLTPGGSGGSGTEPTAGGYARQPVTFDPSSGGVAVSDVDVEWSPLHTTDDLLLVGLAIFDDETAGNMIAFGSLGSRFVAAGADFAIESGHILLSSDGLGVTTYLADNWLDHLTDNGAFTAPTELAVAFFTVAPTIAGGGTEIEYATARQLVEFDSAAAGVSANNIEPQFTPLYGGLEADVEAWGLFDNDVAGNLLFFGVVIFTVNTSDIVNVPVGNLTCRAA